MVVKLQVYYDRASEKTVKEPCGNREGMGKELWAERGVVLKSTSGKPSQNGKSYEKKKAAKLMRTSSYVLFKV